jgi:hypothetical protein
MPLNFGPIPNRGTSEQALNQWNIALRSSPFYQNFLRQQGLVDSGRGVRMSRGQQGMLEDELKRNGVVIPGGMHIDQGGNLNQSNRLLRNIGIGAAIGAGGYFAAPAIAGALGGGAAGAGAGAAGAAGAGGASLGGGLASAGALSGAGLAGTLAPFTAAGTAGALGGYGGLAGLGATGSSLGGGLASAGAMGSGAAGTGGGMLNALGGWGGLAQLGLGALGGAMGDKQSQTSMPMLDPAYQGLQDTIIPMILSRLQQNGLPAGYENRGIRDINRTFDLAGQSLGNNLSARGLSRSPIAGKAESSLNNKRAGEIAQFQETLPILQRQMQMEDFANALQVLNLGRGQRADSTSGGGWGGALSGAGSMLGLIMALRGAR